MASFSVLLLTAPPPGQTADTTGPFTKIDGRESLLRCTELFLNRANIKQIQLCFAADAVEEGKRKYGGHLAFSGVKLVTGGPRWIDQIAAGADKLSPEATHVIIHDAARPAVPYSDIDALMEAAEKHPAVCLVAPLRTTLIELDEGGNPVGQRAPAEFVQLLSPQAYSREKFLEMARSKQEPHAAQLTLVKGSPLNIRIGAGEASLVRALMNMLPKPKVKPPSSPFEEAQW